MTVVLGSAPRLRAALHRLLWNSVADQEVHDSSCAKGDPSALCQAWSALGYGQHWPGHAKAGRVLADHEITERSV